MDSEDINQLKLLIAKLEASIVYQQSDIENSVAHKMIAGARNELEDFAKSLYFKGKRESE